MNSPTLSTLSFLFDNKTDRMLFLLSQGRLKWIGILNVFNLQLEGIVE